MNKGIIFIEPVHAFATFGRRSVYNGDYESTMELENNIDTLRVYAAALGAKQVRLKWLTKDVDHG